MSPFLNMMIYFISIECYYFFQSSALRYTYYFCLPSAQTPLNICIRQVLISSHDPLSSTLDVVFPSASLTPPRNRWQCNTTNKTLTLA